MVSSASASVWLGNDGFALLFFAWTCLGLAFCFVLRRIFSGFIPWLLLGFCLTFVFAFLLPPFISRLHPSSPPFYSSSSLGQDEVGTFPNSVAFKIMEEDLGVPPQQIFDFVFPDPVASASIGQVTGG